MVFRTMTFTTKLGRISCFFTFSKHQQQANFQEQFPSIIVCHLKGVCFLTFWILLVPSSMAAFFIYFPHHLYLPKPPVPTKTMSAGEISQQNDGDSASWESPNFQEFFFDRTVLSSGSHFVSEFPSQLWPEIIDIGWKFPPINRQTDPLDSCTVSGV